MTKMKGIARIIHFCRGSDIVVRVSSVEMSCVIT